MAAKARQIFVADAQILANYKRSIKFKCDDTNGVTNSFFNNNEEKRNGTKDEILDNTRSSPLYTKNYPSLSSAPGYTLPIYTHTFAA